MGSFMVYKPQQADKNQPAVVGEPLSPPQDTGCGTNVLMDPESEAAGANSLVNMSRVRREDSDRVALAPVSSPQRRRAPPFPSSCNSWPLLCVAVLLPYFHTPVLVSLKLAATNQRHLASTQASASVVCSRVDPSRAVPSRVDRGPTSAGGRKARDGGGVSHLTDAALQYGFRGENTVPRRLRRLHLSLPGLSCLSAGEQLHWLPGPIWARGGTHTHTHRHTPCNTNTHTHTLSTTTAAACHVAGVSPSGRPGNGEDTHEDAKKRALLSHGCDDERRRRHDDFSLNTWKHTEHQCGDRS